LERVYQRQYEDYSGVVPNPDDFPILNKKGENPEKKEISSVLPINNLGLEDILILGLLIILLTEEKKDMPTIIALGFLLLSGNIF
jgi:hypothetical protein